MTVMARLDRHQNLFNRMADTLGVDLAEEAMRGNTSTETLRSAVLSCTACRADAACESWLAEHAEGADHAPGYCRNKAMLERLAELS